MAHPEQVTFVKYVQHLFPEFFDSKKVLEIGSLNINGTVRSFFNDCDYTGIDIVNGPCVDVVVESGHLYDEPDNTFDTVCSLECFEHNRYWLETFTNMYRMSKPEGLLFFTCATTGRPEHGTHGNSPTCSPGTLDYYRNLTDDDFCNAFDFDKCFSEYEFKVNDNSHDLYFWGVVEK